MAPSAVRSGARVALVALAVLDPAPASVRCGAIRLHRRRERPTAAAAAAAVLATLAAAVVTRPAWADLVPAALADCRARLTLVHRSAALVQVVEILPLLLVSRSFGPIHRSRGSPGSPGLVHLSVSLRSSDLIVWAAALVG